MKRFKDLRIGSRWKDGVKKDARKLGKRNWRNAARNRATGRSFKRRPRLRMGCCANDDDDDETGGRGLY